MSSHFHLLPAQLLTVFLCHVSSRLTSILLEGESVRAVNAGRGGGAAVLLLFAAVALSLCPVSAITEGGGCGRDDTHLLPETEIRRKKTERE